MPHNERMNKETKEAIRNLGGRKGVAWLFDVTYAAVGSWEKKGIPAKYAPMFSTFTDITRESLRPDIYGDNISIPDGIMSRYESGLFRVQEKKRGRPQLDAGRFADRDNDVYAMYKSGSTLQEIGDKYGFTREYARQILAKYGLSAEDGGQHIRAFSKVVTRERERTERLNASCVKRWGCTKDQYDRLRAMSDDYKKTPINAYREQKRNANSRGIKWRITLWEWWCVWRDSGKWENRGRKKGQYVMSRIEDIGGYEKGNVEIITCSENIKGYYAIYTSEHTEKVAAGRARNKAAKESDK